ncbi:MAG: dephospho-CoA kinase [Leptospira sp.]|nr:dephospho-CoA kinase [Leptospira sp.]
MLGVTGGVGTGKSTVTRMLESKGMIRIDSDEIAKSFTDSNSPVRKEIQDIFGKNCFPEAEPADRAMIAKIAFSEPEKKKALEKLVHPLVRKEFLNRLLAITEKAMVAWEVPLLFETDSYTLCDATLCVYLSEDQAWDRVKERGGMSEEDFRKRVRNQMNIEKKKSLSDFIIRNDNTKEELDRELDIILKKLQMRFHP